MLLIFWAYWLTAGSSGDLPEKVFPLQKKKYVYKKREVLKTSLIPIVGLYILSTLDFLIDFDLDFFVQHPQVGLQFVYQ